LSPATLKLATRNWTGDKPNELYKGIAINHGWEPYPAYLGLGFGLGGDQVCPNLFGTLTSPGTFGNYGSGSTLFWVDPELDMTFVCLTAGVMQPAPNIDRFQRLPDNAESAAVCTVHAAGSARTGFTPPAPRGSGIRTRWSDRPAARHRAR